MKRFSSQKLSIILLVSILLPALLGACNLINPGTGNSVNLDAAALQTAEAVLTADAANLATRQAVEFVAGLATQAAQTQAAAGAIEVTPAPFSKDTCNWAQILGEMTQPQSSTIPINTIFRKYWRFKNVGTCTWTTKYQFTFYGGDDLGGPQKMGLPREVAPGETIDIAFDLKTPNRSGSFQSLWKFRNEQNQVMGINDNQNGAFSAAIVAGGPTYTPTATQTATLTPTGTATLQPNCERGELVTHVTVPDNTKYSANTAFTKTWRLKNVGTCTWTPEYKLVFLTGQQMGGPESINLTKFVLPGQTIDVSVNLKAPSASGTHVGQWKLRNADGYLFGIGVQAKDSINVKIVVPGVIGPGGAFYTWTPTIKPISPTPTGPTKTPTKVITKTPTQIQDSGWRVQTSPITSGLKGIARINDRNFWAVGADGKMMNFNGTGWNPVGAVTSANLNAVDFQSENEGMAVGSNTALYFDGSNWSPTSLGSSVTLNSVSFASSNLAFAVGDYGAILRWNGSSWTSFTPPVTGAHLYSVSMASADRGYAVGAGGVILMWNGTAWETMNSTTTKDLYSVVALSNTEAWAAGSGTFLHMKGSTWKAEGAPEGSGYLTLGQDGSTLWALGDGDRAYKLTSSWQKYTRNDSNSVRSVALGGGGNYGWAVYDGGLLQLGNVPGVATPTRTLAPSRTPTASRTPTTTRTPTATKTLPPTATPTATYTPVPVVFYDFAGSVCSAAWANNNGETLGCPGSASDTTGSVRTISPFTAENGQSYSGATILAIPRWVRGGRITGTYSGIPDIRTGDRFLADVSCGPQGGPGGCNIVFALTCNGSTLEQAIETSDGGITQINYTFSAPISSPQCVFTVMTTSDIALDSPSNPNVAAIIQPRLFGAPR